MVGCWWLVVGGLLLDVGPWFLVLGSWCWFLLLLLVVAVVSALHCEVFELELEVATAAVFLTTLVCCKGSLGVAIFGSPPRVTMTCRRKRSRFLGRGPPNM